MVKKRIPGDATRVFEGVIYDVYQWEQEMFDGSFQTFERLYRKPSCIVIPFDEDGNVYYSKQSQPAHESGLCLFGGRSEEGETPLEAVKRELLEESGLVSDEWQVLDEVFSLEMKIDYELYYFLAKNCRKIQEPRLDNGEKIEVFKTSLDDFIDMVSKDDFRSPYLKKIFSDYSENKKKEFKQNMLSFIEGNNQ